MNGTIPCYIHDILKLSSRVQVNTKFSVFKLKHPPRSNSANIPTTDQCCFNIVDNHWNNVDLTLKTIQNPTSDFNILQRYTMSAPNVKRSLNHRCTTSIKRVFSVAQRRFNANTTLSPRCFKVASKTVKAILKLIWLVKSMDLQIDL